MRIRILWTLMDMFIELQNQPTTRRTYAMCGKSFIKWCEENVCEDQRAVVIGDLTKRNVMAFRDSELSRVSASTVCLELAMLKSFAKWYSRETGKAVDLSGIKAPSPRKTPMAGISDPVHQYLREFIRYKHTNFKNARLAVLLMFYKELGLRCSEALNITFGQYDLSHGIVRNIRVKGGKYLDKPLARTHVWVLENYLYQRLVLLEEFGDVDPKNKKLPLVVSTHF